MSALQPGELALAYEALRAQATGELPAITPRGLALFLAAGFPEWMRAWAPLAPTVPKTPAATHHRESPVSLGGEVVQLLTEMAWGLPEEIDVMNLELHNKIAATHLQRQAYLYVRQSTLRQVLESTESTKRQYALRERAVGRPRLAAGPGRGHR